MRRKQLLVVALMIPAVLILSGQKVPEKPDKPFPPSVAKAATAYGAELRQIQQDYANKVAEVHKKYVEALDGVVKEVTKAGDLPMANRIQALRDEANDDLVKDQSLPRVLADRVYLADMEEMDGMQAYGGLGKKGRSGDVKITIDKKYSPNGRMHPLAKNVESHVSYKINGMCKTFRSGVALNDSSSGSASPLTFKVLGDGVLLWRSKPIQKHGDADVCNISVAGVRVLKLAVEPAGDIVAAHAVWIEPQLTK